jgi:hypothetical protein
MKRSKSKTKRSNSLTAIRLAQFLIILLCFGVAYLGIQPYLKLILHIAPDPQEMVTAFLLRIPPVRWLMDSVGYLLCLVPAVALWAMVQVAELLPSLIETDQQNIRHTVEQYRQAAGANFIEEREEDPELIKALIDTFNSLPIAWLQTLYNYRAGAFILDLVVTVAAYPPIKVGAWQFLTRPAFEDVHWLNLTITLSCVFLIEQTLKLFRHLAAGNVILTNLEPR